MSSTLGLALTGMALVWPTGVTAPASASAAKRIQTSTTGRGFSYGATTTPTDWTMYSDGTIRSSLNGRCLDVKEFNTKKGAVVQLWSCSGASNQQWYWGPSKYPRYRTIRSRLNNFCLDTQGKQHKLGTPIQMWSCSSEWNQSFRRI